MSGVAQTATRLAWAGTGFEAQPGPYDAVAAAETPIIAADSWLVDEGRVLAFDLHVTRFTKAVIDQGGDRYAAAAAIRQAAAIVPAEGRWFPRIDLTASGLALTLREAPPRVASAIAWTSPVDVRTLPTVKGPDLLELASLRHLASEQGATEAIITTSDGCVIEGALSAVLWWRGDILHMPPADFERIDSVTARSVLGIATGIGVGIVEEAATPDALAGCEVWVLSALHGIRGVTSWADGPEVAQPTRAGLWASRIDRLRRAA